MWKRSLLVTATVLQIHPALGAGDNDIAVNAGAPSAAPITFAAVHQSLNGSLNVRSDAAGAARITTLLANDWADAYRMRDDAGYSRSQQLRAVAAYRWTDDRVTQFSHVQLPGVPNWLDIPDGGGFFVGFDYGLK